MTTTILPPASDTFRDIVVESEQAAHELPTSAPAPSSAKLPAWTAWERASFRVLTLFSLQLLVPVQVRFYQRLFPIHSIRDLYTIAGSGAGIVYVTPFGDSGRWGIGSFVNWGIALIFAIIGGAIWTWFARKSKRTEYTIADYWLRLYIRYWTAINILHYAYIKVYPSQMPFPSISNLHTQLGEIAPYRYYWAIVGLSTWYQIFLGCVEATCGSLLLFRRTLALGALMSLGVLGNVAYANFAYDGGVHTLSTEIALMAAILLTPYVRDLYRLLIKKEDVTPNYYHPVFPKAWQRHAFMTVKYAAWILFIPLYMYTNTQHFLHTNQSKEPRAPGLPNAQGFYAVTDFKLNGQEIPYSPLDPVRWQNVIFENYSTLTYKVDKALPIRLENGGQGIIDAQKTYELAGFAGGRTYLAYDFDEQEQTLTLQDKNANAGNRNANGMFRSVGLLDHLLKIDVAGAQADREGMGAQVAGSGQGGRSAQNRRVAQGRGTDANNRNRHVQKLEWQFSRPSPSTIVLTGTTADKQQFSAVLNRIDDNQAIHIDSPRQGEPLVYSRQFGRRYPVTDRSFDGKTDSPVREE